MQNKLDFILKQLGRTNKKNCENYVVTRIYNLLNDLDIKFITQQYVSRGNNTYAFTDMYFPQFNLHVEIDEPHHKKIIDADKLREEDIISLTGSKIMRVDFTKTLEEIHSQIDYIVDHIKFEKKKLGKEFEAWNIDYEVNPEKYVKLGYIDESNNVAFRTIYEACNCFGLNYRGYQSGGARHPIEKDTLLWFPKLFVNDRYANKVSEDGMVIYESNVNIEYTSEKIQEEIETKKCLPRRIVFGKIKGPLGDTMYKFRGEYIIDKEESLEKECFVWKKVSSRVNTYRG